MVFHFLFVTIKIERTKATTAQQMARWQQEQLLRRREEAHQLEAAQFPQLW
ncbi:MAG: hypothetical protein H0Z34_13080 [Brevibacillus sp.]|nr:hypothetical protein [Brevibacillus sp.]